MKGLAKRKAAFLLLAFSLLLACGRGGGDQAGISKVSLTLDWYPWSNHTGLYLARDRGYFQQQRLEVDIHVPSNPEDVLKLVGTGKEDFGISYETDVLLARAEGIPVVSVAALVQHPLNSIMTLKESGITRPKQLEGKTIGTPGIPSNDAYLRTMLLADGADPSKVRTVNVGFDLVPALIGKRVDAIIGAYWVHESILAEQQGYPVNILRVEQYGVPDYYELVLVTSEKMLKEKPDLVRRFLAAVVSGYMDAQRDHEAALQALFKAAPETNQQLERQGIKLLAPLWQEPGQPFGYQTAERWKAYAEWMQREGLLKPGIDPLKAFSNEYLPRG